MSTTRPADRSSTRSSRVKTLALIVVWVVGLLCWAVLIAREWYVHRGWPW